MAIYKCSWEVEPRTTRNKFNEWSERVLNPGSPDLKASALTTGPHCLTDVDLMWTCYTHPPIYSHILPYSSRITVCGFFNVSINQSINITFIRKYTPCSLSTELRALKYITVINLSISKIIKFITDIKTIKLLKEKSAYT